MKNVEQIVEELGGAYDDAVSGLSVEDAIEVAEGVEAYVSAALAGLRDDLEQAASGGLD